MDPSPALERLLSLLLEYPATGLVAALVSLNQGFFISWATTCALCLCLFGLVACVHAYDLAKQRVQEVAKSVDTNIAVRRDFCFASSELRESFERWRHKALFWSALDGGAVAHHGVFILKLTWRRECGAGYHLMPLLSVFTLLLVRMVYRVRLSSTSYSTISLLVNTIVWLTHCGFLFVGDPCFGAVGRADSLFMQVLLACAALIVTNLVTPVCQPYVPLKLSISCIGCTASCYMHMLLRDGRLDMQADSKGWGYFWLCLGVSTCTMLTFHANTKLIETGMSRFLTTIIAHRS